MKSSNWALRRMTVKVPAKLPSIVMGYKVPTLKTVKDEWEAYALEVLAGDFGWRQQRPVDIRLGARQADCRCCWRGLWLDFSGLSDLFQLEATPAEGKTLEDMEKALKAEITKLQKTLISTEELQRIKAQVLAGKVYERDSNFYQAMQLGMLETVGLGWQRADEYVTKVNQVTAAQVQEVAKKYLIDDRLSIAYLEPLPINNGQQATKKGGV